jgi:hypothetical protein
MFFKNNLIETLFFSFLSYLLLCFFYPDLFFFAKIRFTSGEIGQPFFSAYIHSLYLVNGYFNFWDFFDQVNYAFTHLGYGFHNFPAFIEAFVFFVLHFFFEDHGKLIHLIHSYFYQFLCIFFRNYGCILICNFYNLNFKSRLVSILFLNLLISTSTTIGFFSGFLYSLSPILIYLFLRLYYKFSFKNLLYFFLFFVFAFAQAPLTSIGYFFIPFHFFIIIFFIKLLYKYVFEKSSSLNIKKFFFNYKIKKIYLTVLLLSVLFIIFFNISYYFLLRETHALSESGMSYLNNSQIQSRFDLFMNPYNYFKSYVPSSGNYDFISSFINFANNQWYNKPVFLGVTTIVLAIVALTSRYSEKWIFLLLILYILGLNGLRDILPFNISFYAHLFNSFLNPFSFLLVHAHMCLLLLPYFLLPLVIIGIKEISEIKNITLDKVKLYTALNISLFLFISFNKNLFSLDVYILNSLIILFFVFYIFIIFFKKKYKINKKFILFFPFIIFCTESYNQIKYLDYIPFHGEKIRERTFVNSDDPKKTFIIDIQNPLSNTFPINFLEGPMPEIKFYKQEPKKTLEDLYFTKDTLMGFFYKQIFFSRVMNDPSIYEQRHKIFSNIYLDQLYLRNKNRLDLVEFYDEKKEMLLNEVSKNNYSKKKIKKFDINVDLIEKKLNKHYDVYEFRNPEILPNYIFTSLFDSQNKKISLIINNKKELSPVQGSIIREFSFDTSNYKRNYTRFAVPKNFIVEKITIKYTEDNILKNILLNKNGYNFLLNIPSDGAVLFRIPYDENWEIKLSDKKIDFYQADKYWININLTKGFHNVILKYNLNNYLINNLTLFFYFLSQTLIVIFFFRKKF